MDDRPQYMEQVPGGLPPVATHASMSSEGGSSNRSSIPETLYPINEFIEGIPRVVDCCFNHRKGEPGMNEAGAPGQGLNNLIDRPNSIFGSPDSGMNNQGQGYYEPNGANAYFPSQVGPVGSPPYPGYGSSLEALDEGMLKDGMLGAMGAMGAMGGMGGIGFSSIMGQFESMAPGARSLQQMMKQVLTGVIAAQEQRSRADVEEMEEHIKYLQAQLEYLQEQQPILYHHPDDEPHTPDQIARFNECSAELGAELEECSRLNEELQQALDNEKRAKRELECEYDQMKTKVESLDGIHSKYKEIQNENRKLYNTVQDLRGNIRVFCRVRPMGVTGDTAGNCIDVSEGEVAVLGGGRDGKSKIFSYDKVFGMASTQEQVYAETQPLIRSVLDGYNVCIFAYGQTGSGKTHTMSGTNVVEYSGRGINYRSLDDLFDIKKGRSDEVTYTIKVQMLEIYNEVLRDLLIEGDQKGANKLEIRNTEKSGLNVPDAIQRGVECTDDVLAVMETGLRNRAVGNTKMNNRSSRSHSVLTVIVDGDNTVTGVRTHGCLHLVDLAGSERVGRTEASGERLEEAKHINKSLSALGDVMSALAAKSSHVPYRNSKLTQLLQDSLMGQAKAMMFMHIAPEDSSKGETLSTLMFGARVSQISLGQAQRNTESGKIFEAREAIENLRKNEKNKERIIQDLQKSIQTERETARQISKEKEQMESELKKLQDELNLTRRQLEDRTVEEEAAMEAAMKAAAEAEAKVAAAEKAAAQAAAAAAAAGDESVIEAPPVRRTRAATARPATRSSQGKPAENSSTRSTATRTPVDRAGRVRTRGASMGSIPAVTPARTSVRKSATATDNSSMSSRRPISSRTRESSASYSRLSTTSRERSAATSGARTSALTRDLSRSGTNKSNASSTTTTASRHSRSKSSVPSRTSSSSGWR